ncbi:MAG TPA: LOG family protein [Blastocatellia bacterium]|nr:LOG family protein [Blastocatellia bacterium]
MSESDSVRHPPVAYLNAEFLKSSEARIIRILSEFVEPAARLRRYRVRDTIVFFGSARSVPPERAAEITESVRREIEQAGALTPELEARQRRAEYATKLARYYYDAMELARRVTEWSKGLTGHHHFIVCSGGSGGMMEAANRGASVAGGKTIGLNIQLPLEQEVNAYVSRDLVFNFHYFFMRKFWFVYPAKALVVFPGGFGTMDEMFEVLTLIQTKMPRKSMPVILFGKEFWDEVINFDALVRWGVVGPQDLDIFHMTDSVDEAFEYLTTKLGKLYLMPEGLDAVKLT